MIMNSASGARSFLEHFLLAIPGRSSLTVLVGHSIGRKNDRQMNSIKKVKKSNWCFSSIPGDAAKTPIVDENGLLFKNENNLIL
jgi:hypothetical protein